MFYLWNLVGGTALSGQDYEQEFKRIINQNDWFMKILRVVRECNQIRQQFTFGLRNILAIAFYP